MALKYRALSHKNIVDFENTKKRDVLKSCLAIRTICMDLLGRWKSEVYKENSEDIQQIRDALKEIET